MKPYHFGFENGSTFLPWQERIASAFWESELDRSDSFRVRICLTGTESNRIKPADLPTQMKLEWKGVQLFRGGLIGHETLTPTTVELIYRDSLFKLERIVDGSHLSGHTLESAIREILKRTELDLRFFGDFSEKVPALFLGGRSLYDNLIALADKAGFFFYLHGPSGVLQVLRAHSHSAKASLDFASQGLRLFSDVRSDQTYRSVQTRFFRDQDLSAQTQTFRGQEIYQGLQHLIERPGYRSKQDWPFSMGESESHAQNSAEFNDSERRVRQMLEKRAMLQEKTVIRTMTPVGLPGTQIDLKNSPGDLMYDGCYLVQRCVVEFLSNQPHMDMTLIRP